MASFKHAEFLTVNDAHQPAIKFKCAGVANYLSGSPASAVSMGYNGFSKALTAALIFRASAAFDRSVSCPGCNITNMLRAIGDQGLTQLFHQLTVFAWTVTMSQVGSLRDIYI